MWLGVCRGSFGGVSNQIAASATRVQHVHVLKVKMYRINFKCTEQCLRPLKEAYHLRVVVDENRRKQGLTMADFSPPTSPEVVITCEVETTTSPSVQVIKLVASVLKFVGVRSRLF